MSKFALPLALTAIVLVAACAHKAAPAPVVIVPQQPAPAPVAQAPAAPVVAMQPTLRAGTGRIESMSAVPTSSGTGSSAPSAMRRLGIKMDDGTLQYIDSDAPNLSIGERVSLSTDGYIRSAP